LFTILYNLVKFTLLESSWSVRYFDIGLLQYLRCAVNRCAVVVKIDIERTLADIAKFSIAGLEADVKSSGGYLSIQPDREYRRLAATVDLKLATKILNGDGGCEAGDKLQFDDIHSKLQKLNTVTETAVRHHLKAAVSNIIHSVWERFINPNGQRASAVSCIHALMNRYFHPYLCMPMNDVY